MYLRLLCDRDGAIRTLNAKWILHWSYSRLLFLSQLVVIDEMVRRATVEDENSIRGI